MYVLSLNIQLLRGNGCDPTNRFNPATFLCLFQARIWIANVVVFFVLWVQLRCEVIVRFFDIGGIDDHRCLNFLFMMLQKYNLRLFHKHTVCTKLDINVFILKEMYFIVIFRHLYFNNISSF
jgi:hypothetical protein